MQADHRQSVTKETEESMASGIVHKGGQKAIGFQVTIVVALIMAEKVKAERENEEGKESVL